MKKYLLTFLLTFLFLSGFKVKVNAPFFPLAGKIIIIDPGHGGKDPGTLYKDIYEKDINLKIAKKLEQTLSLEGATVILTRDGDYDLSKPNATARKKSDFDNRIKLINQSKGDLYLSIHLNYLSQSEYFGGQVFYDKENKSLAEKIQNSFNNNLKSNRKIKSIPSTNYMYNKIDIKGVLIECGFLSNKEERENLTSSLYQEKIANVITQGVVNFYY